VFLKEDIKRLIEFCQADVWPARLKINIKDAEITPLHDQKVIWVEYTPEVLSDRRRSGKRRGGGGDGRGLRGERAKKIFLADFYLSAGHP
jgi:hypothetical protein